MGILSDVATREIQAQRQRQAQVQQGLAALAFTPTQPVQPVRNVLASDNKSLAGVRTYPSGITN